MMAETFMAEIFEAKLLSDLQPVSHEGILTVMAVIYPVRMCPLPIRAYTACWIGAGEAYKGDMVEVEVDPHHDLFIIGRQQG